MELRNTVDTPLGRERLDFVDVAKGMMILAVVFSHAWFANSDILGQWLPFSMPVFFFLSGYTYKPGRSYGTNLGRRVVSLLFPYAIFCAVCNLFFPVYAGLVKKISYMSYSFLPTKGALWLAVLKADALNMLMSTPMWFLVALFTASILFFALVGWTRESLWKTLAAVAVLVAAALGIDLLKKETLVWFVDLAPYAAALMLLGAYCGSRKLYVRLNALWIVVGCVALAAAEVLNRVFPGSARTSIVQYIESGAWYGVLTAFVIAVAGCVGTLCVARLVDLIPGVNRLFRWLGKNSLWILCIHYCFIMLVELWLYTKGALSNSLLDVVSQQIYGYGAAVDKPKDIAIKIAVAVISIGVSALYAAAHNAVKRRARAIQAQPPAAREIQRAAASAGAQKPAAKKQQKPKKKKK